MNNLFVNITIPVFNEEQQLSQSIAKLHEFLSAHCTFPIEIVIANNGSTDRTHAVGVEMCHSYRDTHLVSLPEKGRGRAIKKVWSESRADILSYMDVDLSTDLEVFGPLINSVMSGRFDVATGSRLQPTSLTKRSWQREIISRCYNHLIQLAFSAQFTDAQCGFKAITREAATKLLPAIEDPEWFFDTELLLIAEKCGYRIFDLPVKWTEDPDSRVRIFSTAWADVRGLIRLRGNFRRRRYAPLVRKSQDSHVFS
jgi:glycosyltransferase involved in cell wall biosynthesis